MSDHSPDPSEQQLQKLLLQKNNQIGQLREELDLQRLKHSELQDKVQKATYIHTEFVNFQEREKQIYKMKENAQGLKQRLQEAEESKKQLLDKISRAKHKIDKIKRVTAQIDATLQEIEVLRGQAAKCNAATFQINQQIQDKYEKIAGLRKQLIDAQELLQQDFVSKIDALDDGGKEAELLQCLSESLQIHDELQTENKTLMRYIHEFFSHME